MENNAITPSYKQAQVILNILESQRTVLHGAVRSTKTYSVFFALPLLIQKHFKDEILIGTKTLASTERNLLIPLRKMYGAKHVSYIRDKRYVMIFGKQCHIIPFNDSSSFEKLQGMSLGLFIGDEIVLCPESYFNMLQTRLDVKGAQAIYTCNPGSPSHYFKKWMDNTSVSKYIESFKLTDNPYLSTEFFEELKNSFKGNPTFYKRYIEGEWINTDGLACFAFDSSIHFKTIEEIDIKKQFSFDNSLIVGIDPANINDCTSAVPVLFNKVTDDALVLKEFHHDPKVNGILTNTQQLLLIQKYINDLIADPRFNLINKKLDKIILVDCAASDFYLQASYLFQPLG